MAINIAKMAASLSATSAGFAATFDGAGKAVTRFQGTFSSMGSKVAAIGAAIGAGAAVAGMTMLVKSQMEAIDTTAKLSDSLGISTKELSRLQYAATYSGTSMEDLEGALVRMTRTRPGKSFEQVADEINAIPNPTNRAQAAFDVFGKSWAKVMPLLAEGSEGLKRAGIEADALGYSFDRVDAAQVEAANDAIQKVKNVITGVGTQLAIKLAPFITEAANRLSAMALSGDGMANAVVNGFEMVITAVARAGDYLDLLKAGWHTLRGVAGLALLGIIGPLNLVIQGIDWLVNKLTGSSTKFAGWSEALTDALVVETQAAFTKAGESFNDFANGKNSGKVKQFFDDLRAKSKAAGEQVAKSKQNMGAFVDPEATKDVEDAAKKIEELRKQIEQFNMSKGNKVADDLRRAGATKEQQSEAKGLQNQLDALEAQKKAHEDATEAAKKYYEETMTPAEKYAAEIEKINELVIRGMLDQETAQRAADDAKKQLKKDLGTTEIEAPKLLQAGTQEAQSFVTMVQNRQKGEGIDREMLKTNLKSEQHLASIDRKINVGTGSAPFDF